MATRQTEHHGRAELKRFRGFYAEEVAAIWLYRQLAGRAGDEARSTLESLAATEERHAGHWAQLLRDLGEEPPHVRIPTRERVLAALARRFGVERVIPFLIRLETASAGKYLRVDAAPDQMAEEEMLHGRALARLVDGDPSRVVFRERAHRTGAGGALRAATFGVNDGLVSNLALVMGVAGGVATAGGGDSIVLLAGIAGLIAGAMSMAAGEWISVKSMAELYEREIDMEREELRHFPREEAYELMLIYKAKGIREDLARQLAQDTIADEATALDTLAREELGLDPDQLGNPWVAAASSFVAFAFGAVVPVVPFLFTSGGAAVVWAAALAAACLCLVGFVISLFTGRSGLLSALRMVVIGMGAAAVTYGIGSLVGVALD